MTFMVLLKKGNFLAVMQDIKEEGDELEQRRRSSLSVWKHRGPEHRDQSWWVLDLKMSFLLAESKINPKVSIAQGEYLGSAV